MSLTFSSGAVDAISFLGLGRVFTANMTGNLVLLGLAVGQPAGAEALRAAASLVGFVVGVIIASRLAAGAAKRELWPAAATSALGLEVAAQTGLLGGWLAASGHPAAALEVVLVAISGLAMGLQSGAVVALRRSGISTTYVTGMLTGVIGEIASQTGARSEWLRRGLVLAALVAGAICSAALLSAARRFAPMLPLAVTVGVVASARYARRIRERRDR